MQDIATIIDDYSGRSRAVLDYAQVIKRLIDGAKAGPLSPADFAPLAQLVDADRFERIGNFKEVQNWAEYVAFLGGWAPTAEWECSFKRLTEFGDLVFLELEERTTFNGMRNAVNSLSVYAFDATGRIQHVDIYLQMPLPDMAMLQGL